MIEQWYLACMMLMKSPLNWQQRWPLPLTYFKFKIVVAQGTTILWICLFIYDIEHFRLQIGWQCVVGQNTVHPIEPYICNPCDIWKVCACYWQSNKAVRRWDQGMYEYEVVRRICYQDFYSRSGNYMYLLVCNSYVNNKTRSMNVKGFLFLGLNFSCCNSL